VARGDQVLMAHHDVVIEAEDHVILFVPSKQLIRRSRSYFSRIGGVLTSWCTSSPRSQRAGKMVMLLAVTMLLPLSSPT